MARTTVMEAAVGVAVLAGALLQSGLGFGFSLVCAPLIFAATTPARAIALLMVLGIEVNLLTLTVEQRRPEPLWRLTGAVLVSAMPGMFVGLAILRAVDKVVLQTSVTVSVLAALALQRRPRRPQAVPAAGRWATLMVGLSSGVLTTSTSTAGPPLILLLRGRGNRPAAVRDTLTTVFLALRVFGVVVLVVSDAPGAAPSAGAVAALVPVVVMGHAVGRSLFRHLAEHDYYERALTCVLTISAIGGLLVALL